MELYKKIKNKLGIIALFALMFQLVMPIYETYVYAEDNQSSTEQITEEPVEIEKEKTGEDTKEPGEEIPVAEEETEKESGVNPKEEENPEDKIKDDNQEIDDQLLESKDEIQEASEEDSMAFNTFSNGPQEIKENLIDIESIRLLYEDGTEVGQDDVVNPDENLSFHLEWTLPNNHGYKDGDYFKFQLPEQLKIYQKIADPLSECASFVVETNGEVTFTFNEKIEKVFNINGTFGVKTELKALEEESMEETLKVTIDDKVIKEIKLNVKPTAGKEIHKKGEAVGGKFNAEEIMWTVDVNTSRDALENAIIKDSLPAGQEWIVDEDGNIVYELHEVEVNKNGDVINILGKVEQSSETKENLEIKLNDTNKAYRLTFKTKFAESEQEKEGTKKYSNTVFLTSTNTEDVDSTATVEVERPKSLEKLSSGFNEGDRSVTWTVNANFNQKHLNEGETIEDEFTFTIAGENRNDIFDIIESDIVIKKIDKFNEDGTYDDENTSNAEGMFTTTIDKSTDKNKKNKVIFKLNESTNKAFVITYKTQAKDGNIIDKNGNIVNKVTLDGETVAIPQGVNQQVGKKTASSINYKDKTIDWTLTVNTDKQTLDNFVLTDDFSGSGQKLVENSLKIEPTIDSEKINVNDNKEGFTIKFGTINDSYTIKYQTKFTYDFADGEKPNFKNGVDISYDTGDPDNGYTLEFNKEPKPNALTKNNGAKSGHANNETKEITWTVDVNYNQLILEGAKLTDSIEDNQSLIKGSTEVYETNILKDGKIDENNMTSVTDDFRGKNQIEDTGDSVTVNFGEEISSSYRVVFKTKDKDGIYDRPKTGKAYNNIAVFTSKGRQLQELEASAQFKDQGKFISKTGEQNFDAWTIDWKIIVNESRSKINNVVVTDTLGVGQILLKDTVAVTKADSTDQLVEGVDYQVTLDSGNQNEFTLKFLKEIKEEYVITYSSYITEEKHDSEIKNIAVITSDTEVEGDTGKPESVKIKTSSGYGSAEGEVYTGNLTIEKTEKDSDRPLDKVVFKLFRTVKGQKILVREGETNSKGKLKWENIAFGSYTLEETIPEGYFGEEEVRIQEVKISAKDDAGKSYPNGLQTLPIVNTRKTGTIVINKTDSVFTDKVLDGATFRIKNTTTKQVFTFTTNEEGIISEIVPFGEYEVQEIKAPSGYKIKDDIPKTLTVKIDKTTTVNVKNLPIVEVKGTKTWLDDGNATGNRPESITVLLFADDKKINEKTLDVNPTANNLNYTFGDLPKYDADKNIIDYTIEELEVDGYEKSIEGFNIKNLRVGKTRIAGKKIWLDNNNENMDRPTKINITLTREINGELDLTFEEINKEIKRDNWEYDFGEFDQFNENGEKYSYILKEEEIDGYKGRTEGYNIENVRTGTTELKGTKRWRDDGLNRPESITVYLLRNGTVLEDQTKEVKGDNWDYHFENLEKYSEIDGSEFKYTVSEKAVPGYDFDVSGSDITNTRSEKTSIKITKGWLDDDNKLGDRPASVVVYVYQKLAGKDVKLFDTVTVKAEDGWVYELGDLDAYNEEGQPYTYMIEEKSTDNYKQIKNGYNITNLRRGKTEVAIEKTWNEVTDQYRPDSITVNLLADGEIVKTVDISGTMEWKHTFEGLEKFDDQGKVIEYTIEEIETLGYDSTINNEDYSITNTQIETEVTGTKTWLDDDSIDRPKSITVDLLADGEATGQSFEVNEATDWEYKFTELPKFNKDKEIDYTVVERNIDGYTPTYTETTTGYDIENLRVGETEVTGEKIWVETDNQYRPKSITVKLFADGEEKDLVEVSGDTDWKYDFSKLDKYDNQGKEINYTVDEVGIPAGYEKKIDDDNITNTRIETEVSGKKIWLDDNNPERPESISVQLFANEQVIDGKTVDVTEATDWTYRFEGLPKYDATGTEIKYSVEEETINGYDSEVDGFDITNLRVGTIDVAGTKIWKDENETEESRPASIIVNLLRNDEGVVDWKVVEPDANGNWTYVFDELDEFDKQGVAYSYTIEEDEEPAGYNSSVTGYDITNVRFGKTEISGTKTWKDDNEDDRPDSIKVNLLQNEVVIQTEEITAEDNWKYSFTDLEKYDENGKFYNYTVKEQDVTGYATEIIGTDITNTRSEKKSIEITKGWLDDNSTERPKSIRVDVYQNDKMYETVQVRASEDWVYKLDNLEAYDVNGQAYTYSVQEQAIEGYETSVDGFNLTNTRVGTLAVEGEKFWKDEGPADRPEFIEVILTRELKGEADEGFMRIQKVTPDSTGKWLYSFDELPEFDEKGVAYGYQVKEDGVPEGYESSIDGYEITNLRVGTTEINVNKKWENDIKENRPMSIEVNLLQNGKVLKSVTLSAADGWKYTFTDLAAFDQEGKAYTYTIKEKPVVGYKTSLEETDVGFELTNTYITPEKPTESEKFDKSDESGKSDESDLPRTGETSTVAFYLVGGLLVAAGLVVGKRRTEQ